MKIPRIKIPCMLLLLCSAYAVCARSSTQGCSIAIESHWQDLENNKERAQKFGGKWVLAGTITFKKNCNAPAHLSELHLVWHGTPMDHLQGSLFRAKNTEPLKPINEHHIADSIWSKTKQTLIFKFDRSVSLHPTTIFYLVLTIPEEQEKGLRGSFSIEPQCLPESFKEVVQQDTLSIHIDVTQSRVH